VDDFHDIHEKRRPDTTSLSTVKHFASCVSKKIEYPPILAINNGVPVHNPLILLTMKSFLMYMCITITLKGNMKKGQ